MAKRKQLSVGPIGITRRQFSTGMTMLGALGLSAPLIGSGRDALADTPKRGGRIVIACDSTSAKDTLDPARTLTILDLCRATQLYNRLIEIGPDGNLRPGLALSWEPNAAQDLWVLKLRKGVVFHNGKTFTAKDAIYTIRRVLDPETASAASNQIVDIDGESLAADDDHTLRIQLKATNPDLPSLLALYQLHVVPDGHKDFLQPVGTGPFMYRSFEPGMNAVFVRNPDYWVGDGRPYLDEIETIAIQDPAARFNALMAGDIHAMVKLDANLLERAASMPGVQVISTPGPQYISYPMRSDAEPFTSNDVRLAMKYAMDRKQLLDLAYAGQGYVGHDHPVPSFDPFFCPTIPDRPYDPDKAKFHLKRGGHENTVFELISSTAIPNGMEAATLYAEMASQAGIQVKLTQAPADGYYSNVFMKKPWAMSSWWGRPTIDALLSLIYTTEGKYNEGAWYNPKFDQIVLEARRMTDYEKRKELYWDAQRMISEEGPTIIPVFINWLDAISSNLKGLDPHPRGSLGWFFLDTVWLDS